MYVTNFVCRGTVYERYCECSGALLGPWHTLTQTLVVTIYLFKLCHVPIRFYSTKFEDRESFAEINSSFRLECSTEFRRLLTVVPWLEPHRIDRCKGVWLTLWRCEDNHAIRCEKTCLKVVRNAGCFILPSKAIFEWTHDSDSSGTCHNTFWCWPCVVHLTLEGYL